MLHHVSLGTNDLERAKSFYDPMMEHLGLRSIKMSERIVGYALTEIVSSLERPIDGKPALSANAGMRHFIPGTEKGWTPVPRLGFRTVAAKMAHQADALNMTRITTLLSYAILTETRSR